MPALLTAAPHAVSQVHCISQLQDGLFFVLTTVDNISPSLGFELLGRIVKILKDYCGVLDEETVGVPQAPSCTPSAPMHNVLLPPPCCPTLVFSSALAVIHAMFPCSCASTLSSCTSCWMRYWILGCLRVPAPSCSRPSSSANLRKWTAATRWSRACPPSLNFRSAIAKSRVQLRRIRALHQDRPVTNCVWTCSRCAPALLVPPHAFPVQQRLRAPLPHR